MMEPPPRPALFPYTTLFRFLLGYLLGNVLGIGIGDLVQVAVLGAIVLAVVIATWTRDPKSTRLNSSHHIISHAVFCVPIHITRNIQALFTLAFISVASVCYS